jgi:hypothetical protein
LLSGRANNTQEQEANTKFLPLSLTMQVFVKSLAGNTLALDVAATSTVDSVKAMIQAREGELISF